jgi:hypothetical protein
VVLADSVVVDVGLVVGVVTFATGSVVVTEVFSKGSVVIGDVALGDVAAASGGAGLDVAVSVRTRTNRRRGLDHVTQCVLLRERNSLIRVLEE